MKRFIHSALAVVLTIAVLRSDAMGRGFGGFHGGGFGGGFRGGSFGGDRFGGYSGDRFGGSFGGDRFGSYGGDRFGSYGGDRGSFNFGNLSGRDYGGSLNRSGLNSFLGLPTDGGMHTASAAYGARGAAADPFGFAAGRAGGFAHVAQGPGGTTIAHGAAGAQGIVAGPAGLAAGGRALSGTAIRTPNGNVYTHTTTAGRGVAAGPNGFVAGRSVLSGHGYIGPDGTHYFSPTYFHAQGVAAGRWCAGRGIFTAGWIGAHPWAWHPGAYTAAAWTSAAWRWATWASLGAWWAYDAVPAYYVYGDNITYNEGYVYYGSQPLETEQNYYQQAANLAGTAGDADNTSNGQWLPLGVFGMMPVGEKTPQMIFQLAVDKAATIRGNCYVPSGDTTLVVHGAVDKKDQRACWKVGGDQAMVIDTGLYNLTEDHSTALVHYSASDTVEMVMVRIKEPATGQPASN